MLPEMIDSVCANFSLPRNELSYAILAGGSYRTPQSYRCAAILFRCAKPFAVARWLPSGRSLVHDLSLMKEFANFGIDVPRILGKLTVNGLEVLIEEHIPGISLQEMLERRLICREEALVMAAALYDRLTEKSRQVSTVSEAGNEIDTYLELAANLENINPALTAILTEAKRLVLAALAQSGEVFTTLCHFDFVLKNLLCCEKRVFLIDFEFSRRSHLWFYDWFRLFKYSATLSRDMLKHAAIPSLISAFLHDEKSYRAARLISLLIDFSLESQVFPTYKRKDLTKSLLVDLVREAQGLNPTKLVQTTSSSARFDCSSVTSHDVSRELLATQGRVLVLEDARSKLNTEVQALNSEVHSLRSSVSSLEIQKSELNGIIQSLVRCPAFRIGKAVTGVAKLIPGVKHIYRT